MITLIIGKKGSGKTTLQTMPLKTQTETLL